MLTHFEKPTNFLYNRNIEDNKESLLVGKTL